MKTIVRNIKKLMPLVFALATIGIARAEARDPKVITIWEVGDPYVKDDIPGPDIDTGWVNAAKKLGLTLKKESFDPKGFPEILLKATKNHEAPEILFTTNYGNIEGCDTENGHFSGIEEIEELDDALVSVADLGEIDGFPYLMSSAPNFKSAKKLMQEAYADASKMKGYHPDLDLIKPFVETAITAYYSGNEEVIKKINDPERLRNPESETPSTREGKTIIEDIHIRKILGNHKLAFVQAQFILDSPDVVGRVNVLAVLRKNSPETEWRMLVLTEESSTLDNFDAAFEGLGDVIAGEIALNGPLKPASLITKDGVFPDDVAGKDKEEVAGKFQWTPSASPELACEIVEMQNETETMLFVNLATDKFSGELSGKKLWYWTRGEWNWRVWSIAKGGDMTLSESRSFRH